LATSLLSLSLGILPECENNLRPILNLKRNLLFGIKHKKMPDIKMSGFKGRIERFKNRSCFKKAMQCFLYTPLHDFLNHFLKYVVK